MIRIVIPTQKTEEEYKQTSQYKCLEKLQNNNLLSTGYSKLIIEIESENKRGLPEVYNNYLKQIGRDWKHATNSFIVFIHDDLEIHDQFFLEKVLKAHEKYDIVGLAGAISQKYDQTKPSVWHLCRENQHDARGFVSHSIPKGFNGSAIAHINSAYFGPTPDEVCVIDGLFISVNVQPLYDKKVTFDEDFEFHHYDMAFCVRAKQAGLKIGVYPIFCIHSGLGEFNTPEWKESHQKFIEKYNNLKLHV